MTEIHVVAAADNNYAMPVAVMVRSLSESLAASSSLVVRIIETGISPQNQDRIAASVEGLDNIRLEFESMDPAKFTGLMPWQHITQTTYARLFIPEVFPNVDRILYLDCDLIAVTDITPLWLTALGDAPAAAAYDAGGPLVNARFEELWPQLGIPASTRMFNAGVFLMNNAGWREEALHLRILDLLRTYPNQLGSDQDGINAILWDRVHPLDIRWNQQGEAWGPSPFLSSDEIAASQRDYRIVHYSTGVKPWIRGSDHPLTARWLAIKGRTAFADEPLHEPWRPSSRQRAVWFARRRAAAVKRLVRATRR